MLIEKIDLFEYFHIAREGAERGTLTCFRHTQVEELRLRRLRPAVLVIPGGAYAFVSQREAEPVALRYFAQGFDCFVLDYDIAPHSYPEQLTEAAMAMLYLRRERDALDLSGRIAAVGFSAGGHLCGCISLLWRDPALVSRFGKECADVRPDASVMCYPVVTADERYWHRDSFYHFCGGDEQKFQTYSLEKHVPADAPPVFLWTTDGDTCVPPENAVMLYRALRNAHVPAELHVFEEGGHGMSVADLESNADYEGQRRYRRAARWVELSLDFLSAHGFTVENAP